MHATNCMEFATEIMWPAIPCQAWLSQGHQQHTSSVASTHAHAWAVPRPQRSAEVRFEFAISQGWMGTLGACSHCSNVDSVFCTTPYTSDNCGFRAPVHTSWPLATLAPKLQQLRFSKLLCELFFPPFHSCYICVRALLCIFRLWVQFRSIFHYLPRGELFH